MTLKHSVGVAGCILSAVKTIICLSGKSDVGKTLTIKKVWEKLKSPSDTPIATANHGDDIVGVVDLDGHKIGIETFGDPGSKQDVWIEELITRQCEVIVCASRTSGKTVEVVENFARDNEYQIIWGRPFSTSVDVDYLNVFPWLKDFSAEVVIELIKKCI